MQATRSARLVAATLGLLAVSSCTAPGRELAYGDAVPLSPREGRVATKLDLLASGRALVDAHLAELPLAERQALDAAIVRGKAACVRIQARFDFDALGLSFSQASGSGVSVRGPSGTPIVLTAGHTFSSAGAGMRSTAVTMSGRDIPTAMVECVHEDALDFAVLRWERAPAADDVFPGTADPVPGELVVALGYPDQCGVNTSGSLVRGEAYAAQPLEPLALLLRVASTSPLVLLPVAGALPEGGFSGGGIFNRTGDVIGVLTAVEWEPGRSASVTRVRGCAVAAMRGVR